MLKSGVVVRVLILLPVESRMSVAVNYIPILILLIVATAFPLVALAVFSFVRRRVASRNKLTPYECGNEPMGDIRERLSVRYYLIAMLFLVFDVETIFLFPWAINQDRLALFGLIEMMIFLGILIVGYYYAWKKGSLEWV